MSFVEVTGLIGSPAVLAWFVAVFLPKHSKLADKLILFAITLSLAVAFAWVVYGAYWLTQHICY